MSITSTDLITYAVGDGTTGTISTPPFESASDIVVLVRADGEDTVSTWVLDTDYTLTGAGTGTNGTLTPITTKPVDAVIVIYTDPASTLTFDFSALPSALQSPLKSALHQLSLQVRSLKAQQRQVIKTSIFDLVSQNNAGQAAIDTDRLGKLLLWNASTGAPDVIDPADVTGSFVELTDTPSSFSGAGGYHVKVNSGATALEFVATPAVYDEFTDLTDTPASYSGLGGRLLRVNAGETAVEAFTYEAPNLGRDGRTILEAGSITDASAEFLSGATFTLDPTNARHYNIQVGDSTTPLTAAMTIDLVPDSTLWPDTAQLIITKGSSDAYNITLSGLNADGLGTVTLVDQYEGVILGYHHTDGANGPGAAGQKWKIVARFTRARRTDVQSVIDAGGYLQRGDVFPEPGLVESVAGAFVLDWETDFDGPRLVKLVRAAGDVSESLLVTLPEIPSGDWATVLVPEAMTFVAPNRTFSIAASWEDVLGVGTVTITESGVTTATLGLAAGDVVSGGPFGSPTTIATIESDSVFTTTDPCGETDSGTISIVAPAYSIDGERQIASPAMGESGILMVFTVMAASTATTRGEIKSGERPGADIDAEGVEAIIASYLAVNPPTISAGYDSRRPTGVEVSLDAGDRVLTTNNGVVATRGTIIKPDGAPVAVRVNTLASADELFAVFVDPDGDDVVTLELTEHTLFLSGAVTGTTISGIDTRHLAVGMPFAAFLPTGATDELGNPVFDLITDPGAVIDSITSVSESGSLEMDIAADKDTDEDPATVEVVAGEQGLINGAAAAIELLPGTTLIRVLRKEPWIELVAEGPERGRFLIGTTIVDDFTLSLAMRGQVIVVNKATDVTCTLDAMPAGLWVSFIVRGAGALIFDDGTATAAYLPGKIAKVPSGGTIIVKYLGETDVWLTGSLEDAP